MPRGIHDGEKIRLNEQGKPGKNGGKSGDLYIKVNILPHEKFKIDGKDLIAYLPISPWEAVLGCKVEVQNIDSNLLITVPKNIVSGERLKVANNGYIDEHGDRGNLLLEIKIMIPKNPTAEEIKLFEELAKVSKYTPRNG